MKDKKFDLKDVAEILAKSMCKAVEKALKHKAPIKDVLDDNFIPEAPARKNPVPKIGVMYKSKQEKKSQGNKNNKLKGFLERKKDKK